MNLKVAASIASAGALLAVGIVAFHLNRPGAARDVGAPSTSTPGAATAPSAASSTELVRPSSALSALLGADALPREMEVYRTRVGVDALRMSDVVAADAKGVVDALLIEFDDDDEHAGEHEGRYRSLAIEFAGSDDVRRAYDGAVARLESPAGWNMASDDSRPSLGDEGLYLATGSDYGYPLLSAYIWRIDNVLLHVADFHPYDRPGFLGRLAEAIDARTTGVTELP